MGKWLSKFLAYHQELGTDIPDTLDSLSGVSGSETMNAEEKIGKAMQPIAPLQPGWVVTYRDHAGRLCGGADERSPGTIRACEWEGTTWRVSLTDGQTLQLSSIRAVSKTNSEGAVIAAWTVKEHGYDGGGSS